MNYLTDLLQLIVICYVLSQMANFVSELVYELLLETKNKLAKLLLSFFVYILSCPKCFTFWTSLLLTGSLFTACLAALLINIVNSVEYKLIKKETKL
jgi:hypothetical protein